MKHNLALTPDNLQHKAQLFLPAFPQKSDHLTRCKRNQSANTNPSKANIVFSKEEVKLIYDKIHPKKIFEISQGKKIQAIKITTKMKSLRYSNNLAVKAHTVSPQANRQAYISRLLKKRNTDPLAEPYKFMLTGANFNYLNSRILELNSSSNSIMDFNNLDAKYKHFSQKNRGTEGSVYIKNSMGLAVNDYIK
ncbi:hypothetical protein SteCoe_33277 [Stentor coeruleus]|uniref:Uncharacterized protein n=1 Tax=Stentor coeruleus TaxID=5963 RepID=A0A1R2AX39_9CILI|nr:hypothetical protein SteCoe_33277 [Stentor coeruleus]